MYGKLNNNNSIDFGIKNNLANSWFAFDSDTIFFHSWASKWLRNTSLNVAAFVSSRSGTLHKIISDYNSLTGIGIKTSRWNFRYSLAATNISETIGLLISRAFRLLWESADLISSEYRELIFQREKDENDNKEATTTKCGKNSTVIQLSYFVPQICFFPLA